jgi:hypothetical protein
MKGSSSADIPMRLYRIQIKQDAFPARPFLKRMVKVTRIGFKKQAIPEPIRTIHKQSKLKLS